MDNVILMGVHVNMCASGRPFGLRQLARNGKHVELMRDLTDSMYNPARWPFVSQVRGTELFVQHVEKRICPTNTSDVPPVFLNYRTPPALGQDQKDPTHTSKFGVKLKEHCKVNGVECEPFYQGAPDAKHTSSQDFLIEKLKGAAAKKSRRSYARNRRLH